MRQLARAATIAACLAASASTATLASAEAERKLPPESLRGPAVRLQQYPSPSLATPSQRAAARRLLARLRAGSRSWADPSEAAELGFDTRRPTRRAGKGAVMYFHAEHRGYSNDRVFLDPARPEVLIYADMPGRPLVLIGVMFAMPRGVLGPSPGGPITRWHTHRVCTNGERRGLTPRKDGSCPRGWASRQGSEMMHVWFTRDLRSAFAIHAPVTELCRARLLAPPHCRHAGHAHG